MGTQAAEKNLGVMIDCSRNSVMNLDSLKKLLPLLKSAGYSTVQLYTEDTYEVNNEPYFGYMRGRYTKAELKLLDAYCVSLGMELIPCIQTLAHVRGLFKWPEYQKIHDIADILMAGEERTYALIENIFDTLAECFTSRKVNIGMDEAHQLGSGKYAEKHGQRPRADIMLEHLTKVNEIANARGFTCSMWSDMFFYMAFGGKNYEAGEVTIPDEIKNKIPTNIKLIYWDYYSLDKQNYLNNIRSHKKLTDNVIFAGGAWSWAGLTPLNEYAIEASKAAISACNDEEISEIFVTIWGDNGGYCSPFSVMPTLIHIAEYSKGNFDLKHIKEQFKDVTGVDYDTFIALSLPNILLDNQDETEKVNPAKYLLYNDVLVGVYDSTVSIGCGEIYIKHAAILKKGEKNTDYGFIFKTMRLLCECLYYKADLGLRVRKAYKQKDKDSLMLLLNERVKPLIKKLGVFYDALDCYWHKLYKPYGFEVTDIRLGALIQRLKQVKKRLGDYLDGKTDSVPELEETLLDRNGGGEIYENKPILDNGWASIVSLNLI